MIKLKDVVWGEIDYVDEETYDSSVDEIQITGDVVLMCCGNRGNVVICSGGGWRPNP